jgi:hypothetical protein
MIDPDSPRARWLITSLGPLFTTSISHIDLPHPASINQKSSATLPLNHDQTPNQAQAQLKHQPPQPSRYTALSALATPNTTTPSPIENLATGLPAGATDVSTIMCGSNRSNTTTYDGVRSTNSMGSGVRIPHPTAIQNLAMDLPAGATDVSIVRCGDVRSAYPDGYIVWSNTTIYDGVRSDVSTCDGMHSTGNGNHIP